MTEKIFPMGFIYKQPREGAPDFVKGAISIKTEEFIRFLEEHTKPDGWLNLDVKESRAGKLYVELNTYDSASQYKPGSNEQLEKLNKMPDDINPDDLPF